MIERIQSQLRATARNQYTAVHLPPFSCFINGDEPAPWASYAIPDRPVGGDVGSALEKMVDWYSTNERMPRLEFVEAFAPDLARILESVGFVQEARTQLMVARPESLIAANSVRALTIVELGRYPALSLVQQAISVLERGFGGPDDLYVTSSRARAFWTRFGSSRFFLACMEGQAVSVGSLTPPWNGVSEIAGIATLEKYRRRGIASALTAHISAAGFGQGQELLFLTAGDARSGRVYEQVGYESIGHGLAYYLPTPE